MRIILEAYNQYLIMNQQDEYRDLIEGLIKKDYYIHKETINYWRCAEEDSEDSFAISDLIRSVMC